jgi:hypothetical protein
MTLWHKTFQTLKVIETHVIAACAMCVFFIGNRRSQNTIPIPSMPLSWCCPVVLKEKSSALLLFFT